MNQSEQTPSQEVPVSVPNQPIAKPRRPRTGRKRTVFKKAPKTAWPVKGLWESAPQAEKERAHVECMAILEYWLGKKSKAQVARELEVTALRVWQLSQKALSGMMAGLLTQPRRRVGPEVFEGDPGQSRSALKSRIAELEVMLSRTEDIVRVLRTAPWMTPVSEAPVKGAKSHAKKTKKRKSSTRPAKGNSTARTIARRSAIAPPAAHDEGGGCAG